MENNKYKNYSREELIEELETLKKKKYGLVWDKKNSQEAIDAFVNWENVPENFTPKQFPVLKEVKNKEIETDKNKPVNLLIEGDNYHSLAVLNFTHQNKIDVIYIDPPYNTGNNDFAYNDKFVDREDPFRHSKWLSFMEKRLWLAFRLLKNTGVIFISIDDNEQAQLKLLCDEVFGENNFIANIVRKRRGSQANLSKNISTIHEYLLCYAKSRNSQLNKLNPEINEENYKNPDNDQRGSYVTMPCTNKGGAKYEVTTPTGKKHFDEWRFKKETYKHLLEENKIVFPKNGDGKPRYKLFLKDKSEAGVIANSWWDDAATNQEATVELKNFFNGEIIFNNPKPVDLLRRILNLSANKQSIVLDFMAGSGTTGQAVLELNKEDGGNRKFILCTNNEELDNNGNLKKHKICSDVCYPRVEKVINGYKNSKGENVAGLGGNLKYFKTDFVGSDSTDKNKRDLVNKATEMICIKEDIFYLAVGRGQDFKIYQKGKKFLGVIFDIDAINDFKNEAEKYRGNFVVYCFSYNEVTPESEFKGLKNKYILKPIPAVILRIYSEIFKK